MIKEEKQMKWVVELESETAIKYFRGGDNPWTKNRDKAKEFTKEVDAYKAMWKHRAPKTKHARVVVVC